MGRIDGASDAAHGSASLAGQRPLARHQLLLTLSELADEPVVGVVLVPAAALAVVLLRAVALGVAERAAPLAERRPAAGRPFHAAGAVDRHVEAADLAVHV